MLLYVNVLSYPLLLRVWDLFAYYGYACVCVCVRIMGMLVCVCVCSVCGQGMCVDSA